jgi:hypothetical protein
MRFLIEWGHGESCAANHPQFGDRVHIETFGAVTVDADVRPTHLYPGTNSLTAVRDAAANRTAAR